MMRTIFKKEWIKLRPYIAILLLLGCVLLGYFWVELRFEFSNIEPESMMWYRFVHLGDKPYHFLTAPFMVIGAIIALTQFLTERFRNRIRIIAHLPVSMPRILAWHFSAGVVFFSLIGLVIGGCVAALMFVYYPHEVGKIALKDMGFYFFGGILGYSLSAAVVLERNGKIALLKLLFGLLVLWLLPKERYTLLDSLWLIVLPCFFLLALDSFYGVKRQRVHIFLLGGVVLVCTLWIGFEAYGTYMKRYSNLFTHYYLFYSPLNEEFVYQKNFGHHHFEYGIKDKETFSQKEYESFLPFVYWRDLDIQGKLPVNIKGDIFTKERIQDSRLSMVYEPKDLIAKEVALYPFLNPQTTQGIIGFPEEAISITEKDMRIYAFDTGMDRTLSDDIAFALHSLHVSFPVQGFWGKASNLKPYDLGYLFLDAQNKLFNLKRENGRVLLKEIAYPQGITLKYIFLNENSEKKIVGYAIDSNSTIYILDAKFHFTPLRIEGFHRETMKFQLISDPLYYLLRMDDGTIYRAVLLSKDLETLKEISFTP